MGQLLRVFEEVLLAIQYAHENQVLHRDLKPTNIIVRLSDSQPIILDFGATYLLDEVTETDLTTTLIGSAPYIPSEVINNPKHRTHKQDIYACGVLLYQMLAGKFPDRDEYDGLEELHPNANGLDQIILDAIAPEKHRIASASNFRARLQQLR